MSEQQFIAANIPGAKFIAINSLYGHDGFLLEWEQIENIITEFLASAKPHKVLNKIK